jgi:exodeoxyribonuclease V
MSRPDLTVASLSPDQRGAYDGIMTWLNRGTVAKQVLSLGGVAGSGKTTVISLVSQELIKQGALAYVCFTGKAASVLGRKLAQAGIATVSRVVSRKGGMRPLEPRPYCGTIHGLIFRPCDVCMVEQTYEHNYGPECQEKDSDDGVDETLAPWDIAPAPAGKCLGCDPPPPVKREGHCTRCNDARYFRREQLDRQYRLLVNDEASMTSDDMLQDMLSYGVPILAVGDHAQLPPVRGSGSLMVNPNIKLEKIHRQAEGSPIIKLSARIRETGDIDDSLEDGEAFTVLARRHLGDWMQRRFTSSRLLLDPRTPQGMLGTVLVSWTNKLRVNLNYDVRECLGLSDVPPKAGEVVICLKNEAPIYNGMRGVLLGDAIQVGDPNGKAPKWKVSVDFAEDGQVAKNIAISEHQLFNEKTIDYDQACELGVSMGQLGKLFDFSYAGTCHKFQGSSAFEVGVVLESGLSRMGREDRTRWMYTAVTRAEKRLTVIR